jgi:DNA-directed RNA polymerase subunit beta
MIDYRTTHDAIVKNTSTEIQNIFPIIGKVNRIECNDVQVAPYDPDVDVEYDTKLNDKTLSVPVSANMKLINNETGKLVNEKRITMMKLPVFTRRGSFIVNGTEYNISLQNRRLPGIYPIKRDNGEVQAEFNIAKGASEHMEMGLDPAVGSFKMKFGGITQPLYPTLKAMGVSDEDMEKSWGTDILMANKNKIRGGIDKSIMAVAKKMTGIAHPDVNTASAAIKDKFANMQVDPHVLRLNLGLDHDRVHPETLLRTSQRVLNINRGTEESIDRNALYYKSIHGVEDFMAERMQKQARSFKRKLLMKTDKETDLSRIIPSGVFTPTVEQLFTKSSLSEATNQHNPVDIISSAAKITALGEGGIGRLEVVRDEMRALNNSHAGFFDPIHTPESEKIGIVLHLGTGVSKRGQKLYTQVTNARTGQMEEVDHQSMVDKVLALPGQSWNPKTGFSGKTVRAIVNNKMQEVPTSVVDYVVPVPQAVFGAATNLVPFLNANSGSRVFMASKQLSQALPLKNREAPLIQVGKNGKSFESVIGGHASDASAPFDGTVVEVTPSYIMTESADRTRREKIPIYRNFPLNHGSFLHTDAIKVKPGDTFKAGQSLADNNFTKDGTLALGINMRTAYMSDGGYNFEDGITISESASKKLTSEHVHVEDFRQDGKIENNARKFIATFPNRVTMDMIKNLDENGIAKVGSIIKPGEPLVLGLRKADMDLANQTLSRIGKKLKQPWRDASMYWEGETEGVVDKVIKTAKGYKVIVKNEEPIVIADKLAGRHGNKGVVTRILPDDQMPKNKDGEAMEILLNPTGVPSRMNPSQMMETALAKVAYKTGRPIVMESFAGDNYQTKVATALQKAGFSPDGTEELFDPDGTSIGRIGTGYQYMLKLAKQAKTGFSARSAGAGESYDIDKTPSKGGTEGSKALDILSIYALLSHGATANLREMATDKSTSNPEFWSLLKNGLALPAPKPTFAYDKFMAYLKGSGVNVDRKGSDLHMTPVTDADVERMSSGEISKAKFIQAKTLEPIRGGFMDKYMTGGMTGTKWGHINLAEPVVNPLFAKGLRAVLGITEKEQESIIKKSGAKGLRDMLKGTDVAVLQKDLEDQLKLTRSPQLVDKLNQRLHFVKGLAKFGGDPQSAYFLTKYPVLPPNLRPISQQEDGNQTVAQINFLYRDALLMNNSIKDTQAIKYLPESIKGEMRASLNRSIEALAGLNDPISTYPEERTPKGFVEQIKGAKAKEGFFQRKVLRKTQDVTGRGVITPDPKLGVDEVGLPEAMAWKMYEPFIERQLRQQGFQYNDIMTMLEKKDVRALRVLENEMSNRPIMLNRPPSLHKFSFLAFNPKLTNGKTITIPPLIVKGYNADFDGDALMVHVPVRDEAVAEVKNKLMASSNLFNPRSDEPIVVPQKEALQGIYMLSQTPAGIEEIKKVVPAQYHSFIKPSMGKGEVNAILAQVGLDTPGQYSKIAKNIKDRGDEAAYRQGFTLNLRDLSLQDPKLDAIRKRMYIDTKRFANDTPRMNEALAKYDEEMNTILKTHTENNFVKMAASGGAGTFGQVKQIIGSPIQYTDELKNPIPIPVTSSFGTGMGMNDYWVSLSSARRGAIDRKMETADPGAFGKQVLINTSRMTTNPDAALDDDGEEFNVNDRSTYNRFIAQNILNKKGEIIAQKGDLMTPKMGSRLSALGIDKVHIHTVLSGDSSNGINPKSFGLFVEGRLPSNGMNLGTMAGQALAEPLQQGAMKTFHTGGAVGKDTAGTYETKGYDIVKYLTTMPEVIPGSATLAKMPGKVTSIEPNPAGGTNVTINGMVHFVKPGMAIKTKVGDTVEAGQSMSSGVVDPRDLLKATGDMYKTRRYMVEALAENFKVTGTTVNRRILEVMTKAITDVAKVDDPGDTDYIRGDLASFDELTTHNKKPPWFIALNDDTETEVEGKLLGKKTGDYPAGTLLTQDVIEDLRSAGVDTVNIKNRPVKFTPILKGVTTLPRITGDLFTHMGYGYMEKGLTERAAQGQTIPLHSKYPIPAFAYGAEFGKSDKPGTY